MGPNDKINKKAQELGFCCAYAFFKHYSGKRDSHKRLADKTGLGLSTIQYNRRKIRNGEMGCAGESNCQRKDDAEKA